MALNTITVINIYGFPSEAEYGFASISLYLLAIVFYLVPVALVSAEMGSTFHQDGGVYTWVSNAFSDHVGIFAIWLQWIQSVLFYPLSLTFIAVTFSYILPKDMATDLANNKLYVIVTVLLIFWGCTLLSSKGLRNMSLFSEIGTWIGLYAPITLLVILAIFYVWEKGPLAMPIDHITLWPDFSSLQQGVLAANIMLYFSGLEVNGAHVQQLKDPSRNYPKALFFTCLVIALVFILGTISVAIIIPKNQINITQSVVVAFSKYLHFFDLPILLPIVILALTLSAITNTLTWITGPATVLRYAAQQGLFPRFLAQENKHGAPIAILISQAIIVTILVLVYMFPSQIQQGYQMLLQVTNALYMSMYVLMFLSFIRLRYTRPQMIRPFKAGNLAIAWIITCVGLLAVGTTLTLTFLPPAQIGHSPSYYVLIMLMSFLTIVCIPFFFLLGKKTPPSIPSQQI